MLRLFKLTQLLSLSLLLLWSPLNAQTESATEIIRFRVESMRSSGELKIGDARIASLTVLPELYERSRFELLWQNPNNIVALIDEIRTIDVDGLDPQDYHYDELKRLNSRLQAQKAADPLLSADLDLLLTDALIRLAYHLIFGKVDPEGLDSNWNLTREIDGLEPVSAIEAALASGDLKKELAGLRPQRVIYTRLQSALKHCRSIQTAGGWVSIPQGLALKKGMQDERIAVLRQRLSASGDFQGNAGESTIFDDALEQAVLRFQKRHRLEPDGVVGGRTLAELNVTVGERIDQILVNLERARWILHALEGRFVLVDIAGFRVYLYQDDRILWTGRAQVGRPYRKTPVFKDAISYLEFNPTWTVPPTILSRDILPAVKKDPNYLTQRSMQVIDGAGRSIDPATLDWSRYPQQRFPYMLRQKPGPDNALGLVKFMFPNKHMVYLHDTPAKSLFDRKDRTFSSGCIRVEKPFELAELLLDDSAKWNQTQIKAVVDSRRTRVVHLTDPTPVLILYWTVEVDQVGTIYFKKDIYDRDKAVLEGLKREFHFKNGLSVK